MKHLFDLADRLSTELGHLYGLSNQMSVIPYLQTISLNDVTARFLKSKGLSPERAATLFQKTGDAIDIGVYISESLAETLLQDPPDRNLTSDNLDAFWAFAEELSHFHLITDRLTQDQPFSRLQLEWQSEIDKLVLAAALLHRQVGDHHYTPLKILLHEDCEIQSSHGETYRDATHLSKLFWQKMESQFPGENPLRKPETMALLRRFRAGSFEKALQWICA